MQTTDRDSIRQAESEIDATFAASKLVEIGYAQAVWTLLSVTEDLFLARRRKASNADELHIFSDVYINALTYPLRVCFNKAADTPQRLQNTLTDDHYQLALDWIKAAKDYSQFWSLFSLWRRGKIGVALDGKRLVVEQRGTGRRYEAYNRLVRKEAKGEATVPAPDEKLGPLLWAARSVNEDQFAVNFNPKLVSALVAWLAPVLDKRHSLPDDWHFLGFSLQQYRKIFVVVQAMLYGWNGLREMLVQQGMPARGYRSSVWVVPKEALLARLVRYTGVEHSVIARILALITFGSSGIRNPDIATQPLIDLRNGTYALSPFVWLSSDAERNLCVLLNQIPEQKKIYADLTNEKETVTRAEIIEFLSTLGLEFKWGTVKGTNLDLAIVDRPNKTCLCLELKWFIEPAEIREVDERSKELAGGIAQAKIIDALYRSGDEGLIKSILAVDSDYALLCIVASQNWIGHDTVQSPDVPIIKVWHLLNRIRECGSLSGILAWLANREYLPKEGVDYTVETWEIACGAWGANWYGIKPLANRKSGREASAQPTV